MPEKIALPVSSKALARYLDMESMLHNFFEWTGYCRENFGELVMVVAMKMSLNIQNT